MRQTATILVCILLLQLDSVDAKKEKPKIHERNGRVYLSVEAQNYYLDKALHDCIQEMYADNETVPGECPRVWDTIACWPPTPPNTLVTRKCPNYINKFLIKEEATRLCTENGTWYYHPYHNNTWTNYTMCVGEEESEPQALPAILQKHLPIISTMSMIGYSISLASLLIAVSIMLYFRRLHCPRNVVHINLFLSLILRAVVWILREALWVNGLGLPKDVETTDDGQVVFKLEGWHWECKLMMSLFHYVLTANYFWIFNEGLYLHMLIFVSIFSEKSRVHWYIIIGWAAPLLFIIPWIISRIAFDNTLCWNSWYTSNTQWIIKGPIAVSMIVNFIFFLNIVRVLFTKLRAVNTHETRNYRYRKLARSTLVLIPLFGVPYIVFLGLPEDRINNKVEIVKLYFEMFFSSIQGLLVAILFCFLNGEVRTEVKKWWQRLRLRHGDVRRSSQRQNSMWNTWNTSLTYETRGGGGGAQMGVGGVRPSIQSTGSDDSMHKITCNGKSRTSSEIPQQLNVKPPLRNGIIVTASPSELDMKPVNGLDTYKEIQANQIKETSCNGVENGEYGFFSPAKDISSVITRSSQPNNKVSDNKKVSDNGHLNAIVDGDDDESQALLLSRDKHCGGKQVPDEKFQNETDYLFTSGNNNSNSNGVGEQILVVDKNNQDCNGSLTNPVDFRTEDIKSDSPLLGAGERNHNDPYTRSLEQ